jgi:hypothetical protein
MDVAIVVVAYNRPRALARLLKSLARASYEGFDSIPLVISIDGGGVPEVTSVARQFEWQFGEKNLHTHDVNLGLKQHVLSAGDRILDYDGIIMLEEDLMVSPFFYQYGNRALAAYQNQEKIAGVSLYSYHYLDVNGFFFRPLVAHGDPFLVKFPSSCGQAWTTGQWQAFRSWLSSGREDDCADLDAKSLSNVASWPASSWKKSFARYLIDSNNYIVYPGNSLTTNMGDAGHHWHHNTLLFQVPLQFAPVTYDFVDFSRAISYDQFFELESRSLEILGYSGELAAGVEFDLYGQKPIGVLRKKMIVSSKRPKTSLRPFGLELLPQELNIIYEVEGDTFHFGESGDFDYVSSVPRIDLMKHQVAAIGGRDLLKLLSRKLLARLRGPM